MCKMCTSPLDLETDISIVAIWWSQRNSATFFICLVRLRQRLEAVMFKTWVPTSYKACSSPNLTSRSKKRSCWGLKRTNCGLLRKGKKWDVNPHISLKGPDLKKDITFFWWKLYPVNCPQSVQRSRPWRISNMTIKLCSPSSCCIQPADLNWLPNQSQSWDDAMKTELYWKLRKYSLTCYFADITTKVNKTCLCAESFQPGSSHFWSVSQLKSEVR